MIKRYEFFNTGTVAYSSDYGATWLAQTFTPVETHVCNLIRLRLGRNGAPGRVLVSIRATTAGVPSGADLSIGEFDPTGLVGTLGEWINVHMSRLALTAATVYAIVVRAPYGDINNSITWSGTATSGYAGGAKCTSTDSGATWSATATADQFFEECFDPTRGYSYLDYKAGLRLDLKDSGAVWSDSELDRCIERAISDLSRFLPEEKVYEATLQATVTSESWSAESPGTWTQLRNRPIKKDSEAVVNSSSVAMTRNTDYYIDYAGGRITPIDGGSITAHTKCTISYTKGRVGIDIRHLADLIRVDRVEYPVGEVPQSYVSFDIFNKTLYLKGEGVESQSEWAENYHAAIHYLASRSAPTLSDPGTVPPFLGDTIALAASAYALFMKALEYEHQAATDEASARTALGLVTAIHALIVTALAKVETYGATARTALSGIAAIHVLIDAALDKVATHVTEADTALDKVDTYLGGGSDSTLLLITTDAANLRTSIQTALAAAAFIFADVTADMTSATGVWTDEVKHILTAAGIPNAEDFLETGDDKINVVNRGATVAELYAAYADRALSMAQTWADKRKDFITIASGRVAQGIGLVQEAATRIANLRAYIEQAAGYAQISDGFTAEAVQRLNSAGAFVQEAQSRIAEIDRLIEEANTNLNMSRTYIEEASGRLGQIDKHIQTAVTYAQLAATSLALADRFKAEGTERRNEAWAIWRDPNQYIGNFTLTSGRQLGQYT